MKYLLFLISVLFALNTNAQRVANHDSLEAQIKVNRSGTGNSTFSLSIAKLEMIVKPGITINELESQLGDWNSYAADNKLGYEWNDETKEHDLPLFKVQYQTTIRQPYTLRVEVAKNQSNRIKYIEVITAVNGEKLASLKQELKNKGYFKNENLTKTFRKDTWQNKTKKTMVTIRENANGTYSVGMR